MAVDVSDLRRSVVQYGIDVTDQAGRECLRVTRADAPRKTGALERSGRIENQRNTGDSAALTLVYDAEDQRSGTIYASFSDTGRGIVRAKNVPLLIFRGSNGQWVAKKEVAAAKGTRWFSNNTTLEAWTRFLQEAAAITPST